MLGRRFRPFELLIGVPTRTLNSRTQRCLIGGAGGVLATASALTKTANVSPGAPAKNPPCEVNAQDQGSQGILHRRRGRLNSDTCRPCAVTSAAPISQPFAWESRGCRVNYPARSTFRLGPRTNGPTSQLTALGQQIQHLGSSAGVRPCLFSRTSPTLMRWCRQT